MCFGSSPPAPPPPPPDYTPQINEAKKGLRDYNTSLANTYNTAVDEWNTALSGYNPTTSQAGNINPYGAAFGASGDFDAGTASSFWGGDDGFQMEDLSSVGQKDALAKQISGARSGLDFLDNLDFDADIPQWRTSDSGDGWSATVYDTPTLKRPDLSTVSNYRRKYQSALDQLLDVQKQREAEEKRVGDFRSGILNQLSEADVGLGQMDISDLSDMNRIERELGRGQNKIDQFSSTILDQLYPEGFTEIASQRGDISSRLKSLQDARAAEETRIGDFEKGILDFVDTSNQSFGDFDITNLAELETMRDAIENQKRGIGRFSSLLDTNFFDEGRELSDLETDVSGLLSDRRREESRIGRDAKSYLTRAQGVADAARGGTIYSQDAIDAIGKEIARLQGDISGYDSPLATDFSGSTGELTGAQTALDALKAARKTDIDALLARAQEANVGLEDLPLHDEDAMRQIIAANRGITGDLSAYTGGRVGDIQDLLGKNVGAVEGRLGDLTTRRNELETTAQELRDKLAGQTIRTSDDLGGPQGEIDTLKTQIDLYNAEQARDELATMLDQIGTRRSQIETDEAATARREALANQSIADSLVGGIARFDDLGLQSPLTPEQYLLLLQGQDDEEEEFLSTGGNPFSLNLGL